jgi:hypothetical protein
LWLSAIAFGQEAGSIAGTIRDSTGASIPAATVTITNPTNAVSRKTTTNEAVETLGDDLLGADVMRQYGGFNVLCKVFDNLGPIPHHMYQMEEHARRVGQKGKPEAYYFPPQYNFTGNSFPHTYMGLEPGTTRDNIRKCLELWTQGDNGILYHAKAYKLQPGTGWQMDTGVLHAPGSLVTYEP